VFVTYTNWLSPWGGHETSPWHYFGGERAARRYERRHGTLPDCLYGVSLFNLPISRVLEWPRECPDADVLDAFPRYYPHWTWPLVRIPGLREVATWNLALVLRRRPADVRPDLTNLGGHRRVHLHAPGDELVTRTPVVATGGGR